MEEGLKENDEFSIKMTRIHKELAPAILDFDSSKLIDEPIAM